MTIGPRIPPTAVPPTAVPPGALPTGIRQTVGQARSAQAGLSSVREALGLGAEGVDKATEADLTRTDALGGIFTKAFNLKAPQFDGSRFQD